MSVSFSPLAKQPTYVLVFEAIEAAILSGALAEGAPLPTELDLCTQFGVTRSTVREGIRLLEQSGLVRRINGKRLEIARPKVDEAAHRASRGLERHGVRFIDVWEAIATMLPATARLAAAKADKTDIEALAGITQSLRDADAPEDVVDLGIRYLNGIAHSTGNNVIEVMLQSLNLLGQASLERVIDELPSAQDRIAGAQEEISVALEAGDGDRAEAWMKRHVDDLLRGFEVAGVDLETAVATKFSAT